VKDSTEEHSSPSLNIVAIVVSIVPVTTKTITLNGKRKALLEEMLKIVRSNLTKGMRHDKFLG